jgi:6-phosphogluconolactonase/glucosamine-6-phosphate isomerase/deaminase
MKHELQRILIQNRIFPHKNAGIDIASVSSIDAGMSLARDIIFEIVDRKTALFLSGGRTPKELYETLAAEEHLLPGCVGLVDERYGKKGHEHSNEKMIQDTGFLRYLQMRGIPFYPILQDGVTRRDTALSYDQKLRELFTVYQKSIALLGIGLDGHTAGIAGNRSNFSNPMFSESDTSLYVSDFNDDMGMFKERITMTFLGLSMMDLLLVLVFGNDKRRALDLMFADGPMEEIPSRILKKTNIAAKTLLITDQGI